MKKAVFFQIIHIETIDWTNGNKQSYLPKFILGSVCVTHTDNCQNMLGVWISHCCHVVVDCCSFVVVDLFNCKVFSNFLPFFLQASLKLQWLGWIKRPWYNQGYFFSKVFSRCTKLLFVFWRVSLSLIFHNITTLADLTPLIDTQCMDITPENPYRSLDSCLRMQSTTDKVIHMSRELWFQWYSGGFQYYFIQENALSRSLKYRSMQNTPSPQLYSQTRETSTLCLFLCLRGMWCWLTFVHEIPEKEARPYSSFRFAWFWIRINNFTFSFLH